MGSSADHPIPPALDGLGPGRVRSRRPTSMQKLRCKVMFFTASPGKPRIVAVGDPLPHLLPRALDGLAPGRAQVPQGRDLDRSRCGGRRSARRESCSALRGVRPLPGSRSRCEMQINKTEVATLTNCA